MQQHTKSGLGILRFSDPPFSSNPKFVLAYAHKSIEYPLDSAFSCNDNDSFFAATPAAWFSGYNKGNPKHSTISCGNTDVDQPTGIPFSLASHASL